MSEAKTAEQFRDKLMKLLSDDENAKVSRVEEGTFLSERDEYVDLDNLSKGVQRAMSQTPVKMGTIIARSAVHAETWNKILAQLKS